jgi:hypothetical protein
MFEELAYHNNVNRFKANKGVKTHRPEKFVYEKFWKKAKNVAKHVQSRSENQFDDEFLTPDKHESRWQQRFSEHQARIQFPLGPGW